MQAKVEFDLSSLKKIHRGFLTSFPRGLSDDEEEPREMKPQKKEKSWHVSVLSSQSEERHNIGNAHKTLKLQSLVLEAD